MLALLNSSPPKIDLANANIVVDGNSLTADTPSWANFLTGLEPFASNGSTLTSVALGAQTTGNMFSDAAEQVDTLIQPDRPNILIVFEVVNDLYFGAGVLQALLNLCDYCNGRRSAGFKVVVIGPLPTTRANLADDLPTTQAKLAEIEAWLDINWRSVADAYLNPRTIPGLAEWSSAYFYDEVHLNDTGDALLAEALVPVLQKVPRRDIYAPANVTGGRWTPVTPWTPAQRATALWLNANDASTISAAAGVSQWSDKSGNNRHAVQGSEANQPTYITNALRGKSVVRFNGSSTWLTGSPYSLGAFTWFFVFQTSSTAEQALIGRRNDTDLQWRYAAILGGSGGTPYGILRNGSTIPFANPAVNVADGLGHIMMMRYDGNTLTVSIDATFEATDTGVVAITESDYDIGRLASIGTAYFGGDLGEIIAYPEAVGSADIDRTYGYAAHYWGIAYNLPESHPFRALPPRA